MPYFSNKVGQGHVKVKDKVIQSNKEVIDKGIMASYLVWKADYDWFILVDSRVHKLIVVRHSTSLNADLVLEHVNNYIYLV